ncbi:MAG: transglutaminase-like domain-containing protein [Lachnospirales bacterium]
MKRIFVIFIFITTLLLINKSDIYGAAPSIDIKNASKGYVSVKASKDMVVQISNGTEKYNYTLTNSETTDLPLQLGSGVYKILVLQKVGANKYTASATKSVTIDDIGNDVYLNSIQLINFDEDMISIEELTDVVDKGKTDSDKASLLYDYVVEELSYDYDKAKSLATATNYLPVLDNTYNNKKGICYDISSLIAGVLRSNDIPTKLVMGYTPNVSTYHAWNEIYYDGEWHVVDATYDIGAIKAKKSVAMVKSDDDYSVSKNY